MPTAMQKAEGRRIGGTYPLITFMPTAPPPLAKNGNEIYICEANERLKQKCNICFIMQQHDRASFAHKSNGKSRRKRNDSRNRKRQTTNAMESTTKQPHILVVDDEEDLCEILQFNLETEGYAVDTANSAEEALTLDLTQYDLLLLDVMMGEISGFKMASMLRKEEKTSQLPIIFLTAKDTENDMLTGFNLGADDYISKPFSIRQVQARVKAVLRRSYETKSTTGGHLLTYHTLQLDTERIKASYDDQEVALTKKEFEILRLFLENINHVFTREELLSKVWKEEVYVLDRTIDVNITRLRKKIGPYGKNIVTRLGFGYCFEE